MTTRLTLILVAVLASAPVVLAPVGSRLHPSPMVGAIADHDEPTRVAGPVAQTESSCVVIGADLLQPYRVRAGTSALWNRPVALASGAAVACTRVASSGS